MEDCGSAASQPAKSAKQECKHNEIVIVEIEQSEEEVHNILHLIPKIGCGSMTAACRRRVLLNTTSRQLYKPNQEIKNHPREQKAAEQATSISNDLQ